MSEIRFIVPEPFKPLLDENVRKVVEVSGRSTGKSTTNETVAVSLTLQSKFNNILYMRAEQRDLRDIFNSTWATIQSIGVEDLFEAKTSPFEIWCKRTGAKIYFRGINGKTDDDLTATKGFVPQSRTLAMAILDEANEVKCFNHVRAAETTANKFLLPHAKIVYAYNPPPVRTHWANSEFPKMINRGATRIHTTWEDIRRLLKQETIDEILETKENDPKHYAYWYLGEMVSLEGLVLYTFKRDKNVISLDRFKSMVAYGGNVPLYIIYGVDSGVVKDPTAVCAWAVMSDASLVKLSTFYLDPRKIGEPVPNSEQVGEILQWYKTFQAQMRAFGIPMPTAYNECWVFDSAVVTQDLMIEFRNKTGFFCMAKKKKNIERDIKRLQNGYFRGIFKVLDIPENEPSLREIDSFCYDADNKIADGQDDHTIDADKYATAHYYYGYMNIAG